LTVDQMSMFFAMLTVIANAFVLLAVVLAISARFSERAASALGWLRDMVDDASLWLAAIVALVAMLGSLYYSEIANFPPCELCWYQRIAMYPLPVILGIAAWKRDFGIRPYAIALAAIGGAVSIYQYQLERFPDQTSLSCSVEVPCTTVWVWRLHYISIPFMALSGFALIVALLLLGPSTMHVARPDEATGDESGVAGT
jgi:disulfide bond formation protein DsbB